MSGQDWESIWPKYDDIIEVFTRSSHRKKVNDTRKKRKSTRKDEFPKETLASSI